MSEHAQTGARPRRVAVVGSGISGLTAAYLLARRDQVTLFEAEDRLGGHSHTHQVTSRSGPLAVDTGFIVHNDRTYPLLTRLFAELGIATRDTEMSMSISDPSSGLAYAGGKGIGGFLAQPRRLLSPAYVDLLRSVRRFHQLGAAFLASHPADDLTTFGEFIDEHGFSARFTNLYAVPLVSCVWSSGPQAALGYPAVHLFRFLDHHGMLSVGNSPQWRTVVGGSATYVHAIADRLPDVRRGSGVVGVTRHSNGVTLATTAGEEAFDRVVVATHADQALALLRDATPDEKEILGAFRYSTNETLLHRDESFLPSTKRARASWNFVVAQRNSDAPAQVTYWMNRLQGFDESDPLLVTLNPTRAVSDNDVIARMRYTHPIFDAAAVAAQSRLTQLTTGTTTFAGAYHGWGFHEDGCRSGVAAAAAFGAQW